jgi:hypothetical protein
MQTTGSKISSITYFSNPGEPAYGLCNRIGNYLAPREFSKHGERQCHSWVGVTTAHRTSDVNGDGNAETPGDTDTPIRLNIRAWIIENIHARDGIAESNDD